MFPTRDGENWYAFYGGDSTDVIRPGDSQTRISDTLGGDGNDQIFGSNDDDIIEGGKGLDALYGEDGNDEVSGNADNDWLFGDGGNDDLFGGDGSDQPYGGAGFDNLYGNEGSDWLDGGTADDVLSGGGDGDWLTGGSGYDTFKYIFVGSESSVSDPDQIMDFSAADDIIDVLEGEGALPSNYAEDTINYGGGYNNAKVLAIALLNEGLLDEGNTYAFVTDQVDGYLFIDFQQNGTIDAGIILSGLTSVSDFDFYNIL